ncbi:unnamed protein product [Acanthoscelides obtectus]|uniref:Uncharacterized protein n=1 Tax=Acanthoscelides obtectus TaxID=200917 RepID=A0A9P0PEM7_ACAOB|nr:unnamed protein product [Acanthoscelides obtectus]CAK1655128.1 hypothetical protein AOBTE_LOCUS19040 [Acanthoscelides obtectus]
MRNCNGFVLFFQSPLKSYKRIVMKTMMKIMPKKYVTASRMMME